MNYCDLAPGYVSAIAPYQPGKPISELERELDIRDIVKLASNENPLGASPKAMEAASEALNEIARYPDGNGFGLKRALSEKYLLELNQIVLGNGSNDVLELIARAFLSQGDKAVYAQHAFAVYALATQAVGAEGIKVAAVDFGHDLDAMAQAAIDQQAKVVFIANPNNPTGTFVDGDTLAAFLAKVPAQTLVVLDEAYNEYLPAEKCYDSVAWLKDYPNLIISRTFSKAYGLASLRVGYALANPQIIDMINRVRQPFNVNSVALAAAQAALDDIEFVQRTFALNRLAMGQVTAGLDQLGLSYIPSYGNFVSFKISDAAQVYQKLLSLGVIVRPVGNYEMPDYLRVSIGLESENKKFLSALAQITGE